MIEMDYEKITRLYKYRDCSDRHLDMLANNELYFAVSNSFNDPFDCRARKEFEFKDDNDFIEKWTGLEASQQGISKSEAYEFVKSIAASEESKEAYVNRKSEMFQKLVLESFGVCSFSEIPDDILMWSHYSDGHKGFCIEFNRAPNNMLRDAKPLIYPDNDEFPYIDYWLGLSETQLDQFKKVILTKSKHWKYEKEWRLIERPEDLREDYKGHLVKYTDDLLSGIIFGLRTDASTKAKIKSMLSDRSVNYYEAKPVKNKFQVKVVKID